MVKLKNLLLYKYFSIIKLFINFMHCGLKFFKRGALVVREKRGYTLVELSVAMAVGAVVMALVVMFCMSINSYVQTKKVLTAVNAEIEVADKFLGKFVADNVGGGLRFIVSDDGSGLRALNAGDDLGDGGLNVGGDVGGFNYINFYNNSLLLDNEKLWEFECVEQIVFSILDNLIKCKLVYGDKQSCNLVYQTMV